MDDQELITALENVQKGIDVEENFSFIYHRSHLYVENKIRFYVHGKKTASYDVEDITQDVYIYMSTHLSALKDPKAFWSWTDKIAAGKTNDFFNSKQGKTIVSENTLEIQTDEDDDRNQTVAHDIVDSKISNNPEQQAMQNATVAAVQEILADLTDAQKEVIIPFFLYNKKEREIAEELNLNLNTVKSRLKSGKDAIYKRKADLRKRGVEIAVIPFVLLLHVAYRSDEAFAASLTAGMAASGIAKAAQTAATGAAKAATGTSGVSTSAVNVAGASGTAKVAGAGIAVKAAATVAAVAVVAGGAALYKSSHTTQPMEAATTVAPTEAVTTTEVETTVAAEEPSIYASIYGPAVEEYAANHGVTREDLDLFMSDLDRDGILEMFIFGGNTYEETMYTAANGTAQLVTTSYDAEMNYRSGDGGVYIRAYKQSGEAEDLFFLSDSSATLVVSFVPDIDPVYGGWNSTAESELIDRLVPIDKDNYSPTVDSLPVISYEDLMSLSEAQLINELASQENQLQDYD